MYISFIDIRLSKLFKSRYDKEKNSIKGLDCTLVQFQIIFIKLKKAQK